MKYFSYLIIILVVSLISWMTDTTISSIFTANTTTHVILTQSTPQVVESEDFMTTLDNLLKD